MKLIYVLIVITTLSLLAVPIMSGHTSSIKNTGWKRANGGRIAYLDRQRPTCVSGSAMSYFYLDRNGSSRDYARYEVSCLGSANINKKTRPGVTSWNDTSGSKAVNYLDRHKVSCPTGSLLKSFKLERQGSRIRYVYYCSTAKTLCCKTFQNKKTDLGNKSFFYLDRQPVGKLNSKTMALKGFRLHTSGNSIFYIYQMCQVSDEAAEQALVDSRMKLDEATANLQTLQLLLEAAKSKKDELNAKLTNNNQDLMQVRNSHGLNTDC